MEILHYIPAMTQQVKFANHDVKIQLYYTSSYSCYEKYEYFA